LTWDVAIEIHQRYHYPRRTGVDQVGIALQPPHFFYRCDHAATGGVPADSPATALPNMAKEQRCLAVAAATPGGQIGAGKQAAADTEASVAECLVTSAGWKLAVVNHPAQLSLLLDAPVGRAEYVAQFSTNVCSRGCH
jgi:hypothetical protein